MSDLHSERLHQQIARKLGSAILGGELPPGTSLEGEIEQSQALGVSRTAYREAMRILVAKGLIESRPKAGTRVRDRVHWNLLDPEVLAWTFSHEPAPQTITDLFELRRIIEPAVAELAAARRTADQLETMAAALRTMAQWGLQCDEGRAADQEFHRLMFMATHNHALISLASSVAAAVSWTTRFKQRRRAAPRDPHAEHAEVFAAIRAGDAATARRTMLHLLDLALADMG